MMMSVPVHGGHCNVVRASPAQPLEEHVVRLGAILDASQESHRGVTMCRVIKGDGIEVLDGDPAEYGPHLFNIRGTMTHQHPY